MCKLYVNSHGKMVDKNSGVFMFRSLSWEAEKALLKYGLQTIETNRKEVLKRKEEQLSVCVLLLFLFYLERGVGVYEQGRTRVLW